MTPPLLLIRADASLDRGTGHVMRTLAIAQEWISKGGHCTYLHAPLPSKIECRLKEEGCNTHELKELPGSLQEAKETFAYVDSVTDGPRTSWVLLDNYTFSKEYHQQIEKLPNAQIACISDFGCQDFHHPDLVIHSNIETVGDYSNLPPNTKLLSGSKYILIRKELICSNRSYTPQKKSNILITIGGSDPKELSFLLCNMITSLDNVQNFNIRVILGPAYAESGKMHTYKNPSIKILNFPESMCQSYDWADIIICSPSTTAFEALHHNLRIGLVTTVENQANLGKLLSKNQLATLLADSRYEQICRSDLATFLTKLAPSPQNADDLILIDGLGASRICNHMLR